MKTHTFRLRPGEDLFNSIQKFVDDKNIEAGCVLSCVGSLTHATLRLANRDSFNDYDDFFEIVSMTGTVAVSGSHLHISISNSDGVTLGGHLAAGCIIYTTAEIVIAAFDDVIYSRELWKNDSGYEELVVKPRNG